MNAVIQGITFPAKTCLSIRSRRLPMGWIAYAVIATNPNPLTIFSIARVEPRQNEVALANV